MTDDEVIITVISTTIIYLICVYVRITSVEHERIPTSISELPTSNPVNRDCTIPQ